MLAASHMLPLDPDALGLYHEHASVANILGNIALIHRNQGAHMRVCIRLHVRVRAVV